MTNDDFSKLVPTSDEFLNRGILEVFPNKEYLKDILDGDRKISLYVGIDPTGPTLHIGHTIALKKMAELQQMGHKIILLIGDFTGMIGDPTDKSSTRVKLTREEVLENCTSYQQQASVFLNFEGNNPAELKYNSEWLSKMNFEDVLELASNMTVDQILKRDMFENRMKEGKPIFIHEFLYPLLQGYDSVAMEVDGEIGGNDQMFNMLVGRTLLKQIKNKEKFVITVKLLEDTAGKKMGKSEGNMIALTDSAIEMFGKIMSWTDGMILSGFELCSTISNDELEQIKQRLESDENPKDIKIELAKNIVSLYHSSDEADEAELNFKNTFSEGRISEDTPEVSVEVGSQLVDVLIENTILESKNEFRRLIESGAITNMITNQKVENANFQINESCDFKIGKRRFIKILIK